MSEGYADIHQLTIHMMGYFPRVVLSGPVEVSSRVEDWRLMVNVANRNIPKLHGMHLILLLPGVKGVLIQDCGAWFLRQRRWSLTVYS